VNFAHFSPFLETDVVGWFFWAV